MKNPEETCFFLILKNLRTSKNFENNFYPISQTPVTSPSTSLSSLPVFTTQPIKEEPVEPMHVLEPQVPAQVQWEQEKMAILHEIWKKINSPVYFSELSGKIHFLPAEKVDFSGNLVKKRRLIKKKFQTCQN